MDGELKEKLKAEMKAEGKKLSSMKFTDKLDYLWTYYKIWLVVAAAVFLFLYLVVTIVWNSTFDTVLGVAFVNDNTSYGNERMETLDQELHSAFGLDKKAKVDVEYNITVASDYMDEMTYASMAKISALIASKSIDVMVTDYAGAQNYERNLAFTDLREFLPQELYERLDAEGRIVSFPVLVNAEGDSVTESDFSAENAALEESAAAESTGAGADGAAETVYSPEFIEEVEAAGGELLEIPCMILLDSARLEETTGSRMDPAYMGVMGNTAHPEMTLRFIEYMLGDDYRTE